MTTILAPERPMPERLTSFGEYPMPDEGNSSERKETMNRTQVEGLLRDIGKYVSLYVAAKGWLDDATLQTIIGVGIATILSAWSYYTNKTTTMISAVAQSDKVSKVVVTPAVAAADSSPKVVAK